MMDCKLNNAWIIGWAGVHSLIIHRAFIITRTDLIIPSRKEQSDAGKVNWWREKQRIYEVLWLHTSLQLLLSQRVKSHEATGPCCKELFQLLKKDNVNKQANILGNSSSCFILQVLLHCQNLAPNLPTMQHTSWWFRQRFEFYASSS